MDDNVNELTVAAVDDHEAMALGVLAALGKHIKVSPESVGVTTVEELLRFDRPFDVVLLDIRLGDDSDVARNVETLMGRGWPVALYTMDPASLAAGRGLLAGAIGCFSKSATCATLAEGLRRALRDGQYLDATAAVALANAAATKRPQLTPKEIMVFRLIARGLPTKVIAKQLGNTIATIETITRSIKTKYREAGREILSRGDYWNKFKEDGYELELDSRAG